MKNYFYNSVLSISLSLFMVGCGGSSNNSDDTTLASLVSDSQKSSVDVNQKPATQDILVSVNSNPNANTATYTIDSQSTNFSGTLLGNDRDGDNLSYELSSKPKYGSVEITKDGYFVYTPYNSFNISDSFSYIVKDDISSSAPAVITLNGVKQEILKPQAPSNLILSSLGSCKIGIAWDDNSDNESGFVIKKDDKLLLVTDANTTYINVCQGLKSDTSYKISVSAKNSGGESQEISGYVKTKKLLLPPQVPTNLRVFAKDTTSVRLSWKDNADNEDVYNVYKDDKLIKTLDRDSNCFVINSLKPDTRYIFEIEAKNSVGNVKSSELIVTTNPEPEIVVVDENDTDKVINDDENSSQNVATDINNNEDTNSSTDNINGDDNTTDDNQVIKNEDTNSSTDNINGDDNNTTDDNQVIKNEDTNSSTDNINSDDNNTTDDNQVDENDTNTTDKEVKLFDGPFATIQQLLQDSKDGKVEDVTYISVGDSTRADDDYYNGGELFKIVESKLNEYNVKSYLQAQAGHNARRWNDYQDAGKLAGYTTWEDTVDMIPGDGSTTILNISLGINDARYNGSNEKETIIYHLDGVEGAIKKIKEQKPNTIILLTMPNRMVGIENVDGNGEEKAVPNDLAYESAEIRDAYIELSAKYPMINTMDELFTTTDMSMYRVADEQEYGDGVGIHLSSKGQNEVANLVLDKILP